MRETEKRIQAYKAMLPRMRERVIAAVSLLAVALTTMVSSTYAWLVLSRNPEVTGLQTTIAANGNLEIALATGATVTVPANSKVGDGNLELVQKNVTWGNLVNLGDPAYGLEHIVLRPAALNTNALLESPLYAAKYGEDGRVEVLDSDFAYAYWDQDTFTADPDKFRYGVRAISSVTYGQAPGQNLALAEAVKTAENAINTAASDLQLLATHDALQDLVGLMGAYVQAQIDEKLGGGKEPFVYVSVDQMDSIYYLMNELKDSIALSADALAAIYNMEMLRRSDQAYVAENKFTGAYLLSETQANIQNKLKAKNSADELIIQPSMLSYLWQLRTDYNTVVADLAVLETYVGRDDVVYRNLDGSTYPAIETYVNHIADVGTSTINGTAIGKLSASNISSLTGGGTKPIVIHQGIIQRMDKFTGAQLESKELKVTIKVWGMGSTAKGKATTSATAPYVLPSEYDNALSGDTSYKGSNPIAADTFGLALDFWARTNAVNSQLILQGGPVYETREEVVTANIGGNVYPLYTVTATVNGETVTNTAYEKDGTYFYYDRDTNSSGDALGKASDFTSVEPLKEEITVIVGYKGVNRVWDEAGNAYLTDNSTTMGSGSCYVFYPQSPEDQEKSLQLLQHLKIAFIDQYGTLLGEAVMDTANAFEQPGKVTVPVVCSVTNSSTTDIDGNPVYYITDLEANAPTFITSLLYLDGKNLTNDQVLAAGDIQGHLNLQFGTTADLNALRDPILEQEKCVVTATMNEPHTVPIDATQAERTKTVTVTVDGYEPQSVVAYFQREINSTQGIRQGKMTFTPNGDGTWTASYPFNAAGKYVLREVQLDGVTYELDQEPLVFTVEGFTISDIYCEHNGKTYMLADRRFDTSVSLTFSTNDVTKMPTSVKGAFIHTETKNRTTVHFTRSTGSTWEGDATFTTSGEYRMEYLELDGEYTGLAEKDYISINLMLGLTASVYTGDTNFGLESGESRDVSMSLIIRTDSGESIGNLANVWLQYSNNGSGSQENGVGAGMVWNGDRQMYEGTFHLTKPGIYDYQYVSVKLGDDLNYLSKADVAPTITAISTTIPDYVSKDGFGETFSLGSDAAFTIRLKNADSATVDAKLTDESGKVYYVRGAISDEGNEQVFTFTIPVVDGKQDGTWTLQEIYLTNVYGGTNNTLFDAPTTNGPLPAGDENLGDREPYTVADGYYNRWWTWSVADFTTEGETEADRTITVGSSIDIAFTSSSANASKNFGKDADGNVTGLFGTNYKLDALELQVLAGGRPLSDYGMTLSGVELEYRYDTSSFGKVDNTTSRNTYGDYTIATSDLNSLVSGDRSTILYTLGSGADGIYALTTTNTGLSVAGRYQVYSLQLTITPSKGDPITVIAPASVVASAPTYQVYSKKPVVKVNSISPAEGKSQRYYTASISSNGSVSVDNMLTGDFNRKTEYSALVHIYGGDSNAYNAYLPSVVLELENMSQNFTSATMTFANNAKPDKPAVFNFSPSANPTATASIGDKADGSWGIFSSTNPKIYPAGKQVVDALYVTGSSGVVITFTLDNAITINQPQYPLSANFTIHESYPGSVPSTIYSEDGETITLPSADSITTQWTQDMTDTVNGAETEKAHNKVDYYETWNDDCDGAMYQQYTKHTVTITYDETETTYTRTWKITGWQVGDRVYGLDHTDPVPITGNETVSAVITYSDGAKITTEYTVTVIEKYFETGKDTAGTPPDGFVNVTNDPDNANKDKWTASAPNRSNPTRVPKN